MWRTLTRTKQQLTRDRADLIERQIASLHQPLAATLQPHQQAVMHLATVPGFGVDSAQQVMAEVGPQADNLRQPPGDGLLGRGLPGPGGIRRGVQE